jgi:hypothetical protein
MDDRTCPICVALNGYTWTFEAGKDTMTAGLFHSSYGIVWDTHQGSKAHGHGGNCRCRIEPQVDLGDILETLRSIRRRLESAVAMGVAKGDL